MKGFIKVFLIILVVSIVGAAIVGGACCFFGNSFMEDIKSQVKDNDPASMEARAQSIAKYTLPEDYTLTYALTIPVVNAKVAIFQYGPNKQYVVMVDPSWMFKINEQNFKTEMNAESIEQALSQSRNSDNVKIKNIKIVSEGTLPTATREVPYIEGTATVTNTNTGTSKDVEGLISVMTFSNNNKSVIVVSGNELGQFDIAVAKNFIKTIQVD